MASDTSPTVRRDQTNPDPFGEEQQEAEEEAPPQYVPLIVVDVPEVRVFHVKNCSSWTRYKVTHMLASCLSLLFFVLALRVTWWRILAVNRDALNLMAEMREVDEKILNTTFAFSRAQGIFSECFISDTFEILNETGLPLEVCHSIIPENEPKIHEEYFWTIKGLTVTQMYAAPTAVAAASVFIGIHLATWFLHPLYVPKVFSCMTVLRFLNLLPVFLVLLGDCVTSHLYHAENPGFPAHWPFVIRQLTEIYAWQLGPPLWALGFIFHVIAALFDLDCARSDVVQVPSQLGVSS